MSENEEMLEDLSVYPILKTDLVIDETGAYGEPPTPIHRIKFYENDQEFYAGFGVNLKAAIMDLVDSVKKAYGID
jgi:hypothetical protein